MTPTRRPHTSQDFEAGALAYMDLAIRRNILHDSLPADLKHLRYRRGGVDLLNDEFVRMIEGLNIDNWSDWSGSNNISSPDRAKRLESFLLEWNANSEDGVNAPILQNTPGSNGSISRNLKPCEEDTNPISGEVFKNENTLPETDTITTRKRLVFGTNAPQHILQQKGTPESMKARKRKTNLNTATPGKKLRQDIDTGSPQGVEGTKKNSKNALTSLTNKATSTGKKISEKKKRGRSKKETIIPPDQPLINSALRRIKVADSRKGDSSSNQRSVGSTTVEAMQSPNDLGSGDPMQNDKCDAVEEIDDIKEGEKEVVFGRENL